MNYALSLAPSILLSRCFRWRINFKIVLFLSFVSILSLLVFYGFQVIEITKGGYLVKDYIKKIDSLSQEGKTLEISFAQTSSLGSVEKMVSNLNFEKIKTVKYIQILDNSLATK